MNPAARRRGARRPTCWPSTAWSRCSSRRRRACPWSTVRSRCRRCSRSRYTTRRCWCRRPTWPAPCPSRRCGTDRPYDERVQALRAHPGRSTARRTCARCWRARRLASHRQPPGTPRAGRLLPALCAPGARGGPATCWPTPGGCWRPSWARWWSRCQGIVITDDGEVIAHGRLHGEPLAFAADMLAMALAELAGVGERPVDRMLDPAFSRGLPLSSAPEERAQTPASCWPSTRPPRWSVRTRCWPTPRAWTPSRPRASRRPRLDGLDVGSQAAGGGRERPGLPGRGDAVRRAGHRSARQHRGAVGRLWARCTPPSVRRVPRMDVDREVAGQIAVVDELLPDLVVTSANASGGLR